MKERILALVVEKTGYPPETCSTSTLISKPISVSTPLSRRRLFAAIREIYNIPRDENRKLRDYPTSVACHPVRVSSTGPTLAASTGCSGQLEPACITRAGSAGRRRGIRSDATAEDATSHAIHGQGAGDCRRKDRLSARHAGPGPRSRSRPRG